MRLIPLFTSDTIDISLAQDIPCLYANWKGYQSEQSVKDGCEKMLELMVEHQTFKLLNDNTKLLGIWTEAARWIANDFAPRMLGAGLVAFAWVYSPKLLSQAAANTTLAAIGPLPHVRTFYRVEDAEQWLREFS